jgi:hypothetical protein
MKNKILQIMYKLSKGEIKYNLATKQVLDLFNVSGRFSSEKYNQCEEQGHPDWQTAMYYFRKLNGHIVIVMYWQDDLPLNLIK